MSMPRNEETMEPDIENAEVTPTVFRDNLRALTGTVIALIMLVVATIAGFVVYAVIAQTHAQHQTDDINAALCTFTQDLQTRVDDSKQFLVDHPDGIQGISAASIQQSIDNQERTLDSLSKLDC